MGKDSIAKIRERIKGTDVENLKSLVLSLESDPRQGVQKLLKTCQGRIDKYELIKKRHREMLDFDASYSSFVIGIDEVGRGPLFGPVVTCACNIRDSEKLMEVFDSKKLTEEKREDLFDLLIENANCYGIGVVDAKIIDEIGIQSGISMAMKESLDRCYAMLEDASKKKKKIADSSNSLILADYISFDIESYAYTPITKGDNKSFQIACASIIAKVSRDRMVVEMAKNYPEYDLESNKGYGTQKHIEALKKYGPSNEHRLSFVKGILDEAT